MRHERTIDVGQPQDGWNWFPINPPIECNEGDEVEINIKLPEEPIEIRAAKYFMHHSGTIHQIRLKFAKLVPDVEEHGDLDFPEWPGEDVFYSEDGTDV